ncbi:hypothetical protein Sjap_018129 [Stephania japonica]|uniref:Uncharacterized protein n=1 Tax=Stephania japonica TaxID=461633 RepID=A0AAP0I7E1_9MAGN
MDEDENHPRMGIQMGIETQWIESKLAPIGRYKIRAPCDEIFGCWHFDNDAKVQATCHTLIGQKLCSANVSEAHWLRKVLVTCWCDTWCMISGNG